MYKIFISNILQKLKLLTFAKNIYKLLKKTHPIQNTKVDNSFNIIYLGTEYGGWNFVADDYLNGSTIISAGLGEDASFDIEFASKYNSKVIIVDPTPRAIIHYNKIINSIGNASNTNYLQKGEQPISAYDLSKITKNNLLLVDKALWNKDEKLKFYEPCDPEHVSHSIVNYQDHFKEGESFIEVNAITIESLLNELKLDKEEISLIKLDIEGAEIEFLVDCLNKGFKPRQILVEFDELTVPSKVGFNRVTKINELLIENNYKLIKTNGYADFLYYRITA